MGMAIPGLDEAPTKHAGLLAWVREVAELTQPDRVHWCDGSKAEKQLIIAGVVTEVCVAFPALSAIEAGFDVFVVTDASGTFNPLTRDSAWNRMSSAGVQLMTWFGLACELHRDWRNDVEGLGTLFSNHIPDYRNLMTSYSTLASGK